MAVKSESLTIKREQGDYTLTATQLPPTRALKFISRLAEMGLMDGSASPMVVFAKPDILETLLGTVHVSTPEGKGQPMSQPLFDGLFAGHLKESVEFLTFALNTQMSDFLDDSKKEGSLA